MLNAWVTQTVPLTVNLNAVINDGTRYIALGADLPAATGIYTLASLTGLGDWVAETNATEQGGAGRIASGPGLVGTLQSGPGGNSTFNQSTDGGITWTGSLTAVSLTSPNTGLIRVAGRWIAVGGITGIMFADDGTGTWTLDINASSLAIPLRSIASNPDGTIIVAIGDDTAGFGNGPHIIRSVDKGITWTLIESNVGGSNHMVDIAHTGTQFIAVGNNGQILRSLDGLSWSLQFAPGLLNLLHIHGHDGLTVITGVDQGGGQGPLIILSEDAGESWVKGLSPTTITNLNGVSVVGNDFVVVGDGGKVLTNSNNPDFSVQVGLNETKFYLDLAGNAPNIETNTLLIPVFSFSLFNRISDAVAITPPAAFDEVTVVMRGTVVFGGIITAVSPRKVSGAVLIYDVTSVGYHKTLDYVETFRDNFASANAGVIIRTLLNKYAPWLTATVANVQDGPVVSQLDVRNRNMSELFSELAQDAGFVFFVDNNKNSFFKPKDQYKTSLLVKDAATTYIPDSLEITPDFSRVVNVVKVIGGPQKSISITEVFAGGGPLVANFPLEFKPFGISQASLLEDDFSGTVFSPAQWLETDVDNPSPPPNHVATDGYIFPEFSRLQIVGGNGTLGQVALTSTETYQGKIGREFLCEEVFITVLSEGIVCAVTDGIGSTLADVKTGFFLKSNGALHIVVNGVDTTLTQYTDIAGVVQVVAPTVELSKTYNFMVRITAIASNIVASLEIQGGVAPNYGAVGGRSWSVLSSVTLSATPDPTFVGFAPILSTNAQFTIRSAKLRGQVPASLTVDGVAKVIGTETATSTFMDAFIDVNSVPNRLRFFADTNPATGVGTIPANLAVINITYDKTEETVVRRRNSESIVKIKAASKLKSDSGERHATIKPPFLAKTLDDLVRIALNYLTEFANEKYTGRLVTYTPLLTDDADPPSTGQFLNLDLPSQKIGPLEVVISQITQTIISSNYQDGALKTGPIIQYEIEFADVDTYQDFIKRNQQDLKVINKEGDSSQFLDVFDVASVIDITEIVNSTVHLATNAIVGEAVVVLAEVGVGSD